MDEIKREWREMPAWRKVVEVLTFMFYATLIAFVVVVA